MTEWVRDRRMHHIKPFVFDEEDADAGEIFAMIRGRGEP
jgi:hypothetical protein